MTKLEVCMCYQHIYPKLQREEEPHVIDCYIARKSMDKRYSRLGLLHLIELCLKFQKLDLLNYETMNLPHLKFITLGYVGGPYVIRQRNSTLQRSEVRENMWLREMLQLTIILNMSSLINILIAWYTGYFERSTIAKL